MKRSELEASLRVTLKHLEAAHKNCDKVLQSTALDSSEVSKEHINLLVLRLEKATGIC